MKTLLEVHHAFVSYGDMEVVHDVNLSLQEGELTALLGLNGSGKTSLIRGICGLIPAKGSFVVNGKQVGDLKGRERARYLSYIPQVHSAIEGKTAFEIVLMGANPHLGILETPGKAYEKKAEDAMKKLGILSFRDRFFQELSQGQKQLVVLARTLVQDTPVMLMDEPDSALDFCNRHMVMEKIRETVKTEGKAGMITLHDPNFALMYCDRLLLFREGNLMDQLTVRGAQKEEIAAKLEKIYGEVELLSYSGGYLMGKRQTSL